MRLFVMPLVLVPSLPRRGLREPQERGRIGAQNASTRSQTLEIPGNPINPANKNQSSRDFKAVQKPFKNGSKKFKKVQNLSKNFLRLAGLGDAEGWRADCGDIRLCPNRHRCSRQAGIRGSADAARMRPAPKLAWSAQRADGGESPSSAPAAMTAAEAAPSASAAATGRSVCADNPSVKENYENYLPLFQTIGYGLTLGPPPRSPAHMADPAVPAPPPAAALSATGREVRRHRIPERARRGWSAESIAEAGNPTPRTNRSRQPPGSPRRALFDGEERSASKVPFPLSFARKPLKSLEAAKMRRFRGRS
ncbi:MAG: hypothetical protein ABR970_22425, partial [Roseiarcus sp.]